MKPYIKYIDSCSLNSFRLYHKSDIFLNPQKYRINIIDEVVKVGEKYAPLSFIEYNFSMNVEKRKKIFVRNFNKWENFLKENNVVINLKLFPLLASLYKEFSWENKQIIKKYVLNYYKNVVG